MAKRDPAARKKSPRKKKSPAKKKARRPVRKTSAASLKRRKKLPPLAPDESREADFEVMSPSAGRGLGPEAGGQSGDLEGLSRDEIADSESVAELLEEGQTFEAGVVSGVENAPDADEGEVTTREVPTDDVPQEYLDKD